jgi:hypothetical protein
MTHSPDARLSRSATAEALTAAGFPIAPATLATMACRGGGPEFVLFNGRALYRLGDALAWAEARAKPRAPRARVGEAA